MVYRLLPLAVWVATALAFDDRARALQSRQRQKALLPAVGDCRVCHGNLLADGLACAHCGNPLWNYEWLTAV